MKNKHRKLLALLLCILMVLPGVSCAEELNPGTTNESSDTSGNMSEGDATDKPTIATKNYDCDFNIVIPDNNPELCFDKNLILVEAGGGDTLSDSVYERSVRIKDHLGVNLVQQDAGDWIEYSANVIKTVQSGDDDYQLVMTSTYQGLTDLITSNALYDLGALESVDLDAQYWKKNLMDEIKVADQYLLGYSDLCLSKTHCLVFNKDMMEKYNMDVPYQLVRDKQWTLEKLMEMASLIKEDNGDSKWDNQDTYGITGWGWTYLISFITSSNLKIVDRDGEGLYKIAYNNNPDKINDLIETVFDLYNAEYSYFWGAWENASADKIVDFSNGTSLFQFYSSDQLTELRSSKIPFGVLPYPLYDENQESYKSLNWNGLMAVPTTIKNPDMVGEVLELLAYYTAPVKIAYYEDLLGSKLANAPEDAEMLDVIWDSQVSDVGLIICNCHKSMDSLVYMIPQMCEGGNNIYTSYIKKFSSSAQKGLDRVFDQ